MQQYKFYVKDIPDDVPIWQYMAKESGLADRYRKGLVPKCELADPTDLVPLNHTMDMNSIIASTQEMIDKFGFKPWQSMEYGGNAYGGLSLVYNPDYVEDVEPNQQTLGTKTNKREEFVYNTTHRFASVRNTYFDSYAYRLLSPCVTETSFKEIATSFSRHITRSRMATINAQHVSDELRPKFGWHRDEMVFENVRINIPIVTDSTFLFQIEGKDPVHLEVGNMYTWDTNIMHRVFPTTSLPKSRSHLVLGFSPWFDYNEEEDFFYSNEFFGEMHPIDMIINGNIHEKIKGILSK